VPPRAHSRVAELEGINRRLLEQVSHLATKSPDKVRRPLPPLLLRSDRRPTRARTVQERHVAVPAAALCDAARHAAAEPAPRPLRHRTSQVGEGGGAPGRACAADHAHLKRVRQSDKRQPARRSCPAGHLSGPLRSALSAPLRSAAALLDLGPFIVSCTLYFPVNRSVSDTCVNGTFNQTFDPLSRDPSPVVQHLLALGAARRPSPGW
jgi:hypothetical protein